MACVMYAKGRDYKSGKVGAFTLNTPLAIDMATIPADCIKDVFPWVNLNVGMLRFGATIADNSAGYVVRVKSIILKWIFPNRNSDFNPRLHS